MLPILKLATLLIKQFTRPVVNTISESAKQYPKFRSIIVKLAQRYHLSDFTSQSKLFGFGKPLRVKPLSEDEALNLGTRLLGETLVYGISAGLLLAEYNRSSKNDQIKEEKRKFEIATLQRKIHDYGIVTEQQATEIKELRRKMYQLEDNNKSLASKLFSSLKTG
ncbi:optic atrophy 3 protein homolog [Mytilus californianus]|uniref:optic atrophy 3 protein homolog n=1 Tax=Mytilus californianus TaxID=6549 RepID=UPI0022464B1B|nr:optic atrophy 3 protein homolog [Mytilus californianus]